MKKIKNKIFLNESSNDKYIFARSWPAKIIAKKEKNAPKKVTTTIDFLLSNLSDK